MCIRDRRRSGTRSERIASRRKRVRGRELLPSKKGLDGENPCLDPVGIGRTMSLFYVLGGYYSSRQLTPRVPAFLKDRHRRLPELPALASTEPPVRSPMSTELSGFPLSSGSFASAMNRGFLEDGPLPHRPELDGPVKHDAERVQRWERGEGSRVTRLTTFLICWEPASACVYCRFISRRLSSAKWKGWTCFKE